MQLASSISGLSDWEALRPLEEESAHLIDAIAGREEGVFILSAL